MKPKLAQRQVHLDFHTSPHIPGVGADFNPEEFAQAFKRAHVNSVTVFAKCHHGHLYYPTDHPARHPTLDPKLDLCGEQVKALHAAGIRAPVYISVQCDEFAADTHPEWIARNPDGTNVGPKPLEPGWQILDMSSPYLEYLEAQTEEILKRYAPVDGAFFDMCWNQVSVSNWAVDGMLMAGLDPTKEEDRQRYAADVADRYMGRLAALVKKYSPEGTCYFNSRPLGGLAHDIRHLTHTEIEALPTGGWGYMYFPRNVRYVRTFPKPYMGMTARFHKSWGDFGSLKPYPALLYEITQMLAHGAPCSIGDQLHPRGRPEPAVYDLIGKVYRYAEACEPWTDEAKPLADIGLFRVDDGRKYTMDVAADDGATRMLTHLKHQFDVVNPESDWNPYRVLILPDAIPVDAALAKRLEAFVAKGGALILSGRSGLDADGKPVLDLGVAPEGDSPYKTTFLRFPDASGVAAAKMDHVLYERTIRAKATAGAEVLAQVVEPYFDRNYLHFCSHFQTPNRPEASPYAAAVQKGRVVYLPFPVFTTFGQHGCSVYRQLVAACIARFLPEPLVKVDMPVTGEATILRQGDRTVVHLLQFVADRRGDLDLCEDIVPLHDVALSVRLPKKPSAALLAPSKEPLSFAWENDRAEVVVPKVNGHQMVVFED